MLWLIAILCFLGWILGLTLFAAQVGWVVHILLAIGIVAAFNAVRRRSNGDVQPPTMEGRARTRA